MQFPKIGILGGGQLGRMLLQVAIDLDLQVAILDPDPKAPCSNLIPDFQVGSLKDYDSVYQFGQGVDLLTIEIENVNVEALEALEQEGKKVYPQPAVIQTIQDKREQKLFYQKHSIPTSDFVLIENKEELRKYNSWLPAVLKLGKEGYDGKGVMILKDTSDFENAFEAPCVLERKVAIEKEIAVIVARRPSGEVTCFPATEMVFDPQLNLVDYLIAPAHISPAIAKEAAALAKKVILSLDMIGLLAVEMFLTKEGELLVNESAPRPHNSGHHTMKANFTSQFEQHWRAILDLPLGNTETKIQSAMLNIIGKEGETGAVFYEGWKEILDLTGVSVHLYGKKITKPGRKMGHVIILENNLHEIKQKILHIKQHFQTNFLS